MDRNKFLMRFIMSKIFVSTLTMLMLLNSCLEQTTTTTSNSDDDTTGTTTTVTDTDDSSDSNSNSTSSCTGTTSDGSGDGLSLYHFDMLLAGHQTWVPGTYSNSLASSTMPTIDEASALFQSDSKLDVRFMIKSQPYPTAGEEYCYGRSTGQAADPYVYTKLRFRVALRDILCDNVDPNDSTNCLSNLYLGNPYGYRYIDPVSVDSCSEVISLGSSRNATTFGTTIQVDQVQADSTCQQHGTYCPAEKIVRAASCWRMKLQISTDYTQSF